MEKLYALKRMGVKISVDGFGTGFSSLSYLHKSPVDTLKIDKTIVQDIFTDISTSPIIEAIMAMSHSLILSVIAVGVKLMNSSLF